MNTYPLLTQQEQVDLPRLNAAPIALPSKFEDSTHQIFVCDTVDGRMVLKVCDHAVIGKSGFWLGLNQLFGADFPNSLGRIQGTHNLLTEQGCCIVPDYVASRNNRFVLTRFVAGVDVDVTRITDDMVEQLATHIGKLHQHTRKTWGSVHTPTYKPNNWREHLHQSILTLAAQSAVSIPESLLREVLAQVKMQQETAFVPIMLDLRWDQFRTLDHSSKLALVDLDAFAIGPHTLELVLLEYVLTPHQFALFKSAYTAKNDWPDYSMQKQSYQLLLFLMQVLGETDLEKWMNQ